MEDDDYDEDMDDDVDDENDDVDDEDDEAASGPDWVKIANEFRNIAESISESMNK